MKSIKFPCVCELTHREVDLFSVSLLSALCVSGPLCSDCGSPPVLLPLCLLLDVSGERSTLHDSPKPAGHELHDISTPTFPIRLYSRIWNSCHHHYYLCSNATWFIWNRKLVSCLGSIEKTYPFFYF